MQRGDQPDSKPKPQAGIPDLRFINREIPIAEVARALDLRFGSDGRLHCWHPERHKNGDQNPSVAIWTTMNRVKCFGCDFKPMTPTDLVMDVLGLDVGQAAGWIAQRFQVPRIPKGRHLRNSETRHRVGFDHGLGPLVQSGIWASLSESTRSIAPVLVQFSDPGPLNTFTVTLSYRGISRYSGVISHTAIRKAIVALDEIGWLQCPEAKRERSGPLRQTSTYTLTPYSDRLWQLANATAEQFHTEIAEERELRRRSREAKRRAQPRFPSA